LEIVAAVVVYLAVAGMVGNTVMTYGYGRIPGVHRDNNRLWLGIGVVSIPVAYLVWKIGWLAFGVLFIAWLVVAG